MSKTSRAMVAALMAAGHELADQGFTASENRVWRLCSAQRIFSTHAKKRGLHRQAGPPVHDDLLAGVDAHGRPTDDFTATRVNEKWLTHITEHPTAEGKLCLCAVKDCYSTKIVGSARRWHRAPDEAKPV